MAGTITAPEAADPILRIVPLASLFMVIASTQGARLFRLYSGSWRGRLATTFELAHWRSTGPVGHSQHDGPRELIWMEATVLPDDYLTAADELLSRAHMRPDDIDRPRLQAQVVAIQAVAAAINRLAAAVEALSPPSPSPTVRD